MEAEYVATPRTGKTARRTLKSISRAVFIRESGILTFSFFAGTVAGCALTLLGLHWAGVLAL